MLTNVALAAATATRVLETLVFIRFPKSLGRGGGPYHTAADHMYIFSSLRLMHRPLLLQVSASNGVT